ncbi:MAG TPA: hypothetical protein GXZ40_09235 [Bacteroidales bacterium]|jgi:hypothetical protein|nr:hypothetical protein [Bacteroidales bacterium]
MKLFILFSFFLTVCFDVFTQGEYVQVKMEKYIASSMLESEIQIIVDKIKPKDSQLCFVVNIEPRGDDYIIFVSTTISVYKTAIPEYVGYFEVKERQFLMLQNTPELFFTSCGQGTISINVEPEPDVDPQKPFSTLLYVDELPMWIMRYEKGIFTTVFAAY